MRAYPPIDTMSNVQQTGGFGWMCESVRKMANVSMRILLSESLDSTLDRSRKGTARHDDWHSNWLDQFVCVRWGCANAKRLCPFRFGAIFGIFFRFWQTLKRPFNCCYRFQMPLQYLSCLIDSSRIRIEQRCNEGGNPACEWVWLLRMPDRFCKKSKFIWIDVSAILTTLILWAFVFIRIVRIINGIQQTMAAMADSERTISPRERMCVR